MMMRKGIYIGILSFILLIFAANAFLVSGFPTQTEECGTCHTNTGVLTLTSNATDTVEAVNGIPFVLSIDGSNGVETLKIVSDWADNSQFTFSITQIDDGDSNDGDSATGEIAADIVVTPITTGTFTIRMWVAAANQLSASLDVTVNVSENTSTTNTTTTSTTTTPTATTTEPEPDPVETWTFLMMTLNPLVAVILLITGIVLCKRTGR